MLAGINKKVQNQLAEINFCHYSMQIVGMLENQKEIYDNTEIERISHMTQVSKNLISILGLNSNLTIKTPLTG